MQEEYDSASKAVTIDDSNAKLGTPVAKKRGRPTKKVAEAKVVGTVQWTDLMVEALLKNRLHTFKVDFLSAKEKNAVIKGWLKVVLAINAIGQSVVDSVKARIKYQTLKP